MKNSKRRNITSWNSFFCLKKIDELSNLLGKLNDDNEKLNKNANENKRLNNKLLEEKKD